MAGQQQIVEYNKDSLKEKCNKAILQEANTYYNNKYYKIKPKYNDSKFLHSLLLNKALNNENCELNKFLNKRLRGALGDENIDIVDLKTMQTKYRDINNYYSESFEWQEEKW